MEYGTSMKDRSWGSSTGPFSSPPLPIPSIGHVSIHLYVLSSSLCPKSMAPEGMSVPGRVLNWSILGVTAFAEG